MTQTIQTANRRQARKVFLVTLVLNAGLALSKLICGIATGALTMVSDGFHSLLYASSNIVGMWRCRFH